MIIDVAYDTLFVFGNQPVEELAKDYNIDPSLVATVENAEGNESFCAGCYNPGYSVYIFPDKIVVEDSGPFILCSLAKCGPTQIFDTFIHEFNHLIKWKNKGLIHESDENQDICRIRVGLNIQLYTLDKDTGEYTKENAFVTLDECVNVLQTAEIKKLIYSYKDILSTDEDIAEYVASLNEESINTEFGYGTCVDIFKRLWANEKYKKILEADLISGDIDNTVDTFNGETYDGALADLADYLDDIDFLEYDSNHQKEYRELIDEANEFIDELNTKYTKQK